MENLILMEKNNRCLLIVDDEDGIREIIQDLASEVTPNVRTAANGKEALEIVKQGGIDAIISDLNMPVMTGIELLTSVRQLGFETPFVVLTGFGDSQTMAEALRLGATDFIDKPFNSDNLIRILEHCLELGGIIKDIDHEIKEICKSANISDEKIKSLKSAKVSMWLMKKNRIAA